MAADLVEAYVQQRVHEQRNADGVGVDRYYPGVGWFRVSKFETKSGATAGFAVDINENKRYEAPGYEAMVWYGFVAPKGTPDAVIKRLHQEVGAAAQSTEVIAGIKQLGFETSLSEPQAFDEQMAAEYERTKAIVAGKKSAGG